MSSRFLAELQRLDSALRLCPNRVLLKSGSADSWAACDSSLQAVRPVLQEWAIADQNCPGAAAVVMQWRKSSVSKKVLALLRAVVEEAPALAPVDAASLRYKSVRCSITVVSIFWQHTQHSAAAWPAMREWLFEQGGIKNIWTALAWCMSCTSSSSSPAQEVQASGDEESHRLLTTPFLAALVLTKGLTADPRTVGSELFENRGFISSLELLLSGVLPQAIAAGCGPAWKLGSTLSFISAVLSSPANGYKLVPLLHCPLLVSWPSLIAELRRMSQATTGSVPPAGRRVEVRSLYIPMAHR